MPSFCFVPQRAVQDETPSSEPIFSSAIEPKPAPERASGAKRVDFWAIMAGVTLSSILGSLEVTIVPTAMPTIVHALGSTGPNTWAATAYQTSQ